MDSKDELVENWLIEAQHAPLATMQTNPEELEDALIKAEELFGFVVSLLPDEIKTFLA
jgi:hypothetical protein